MPRFHPLTVTKVRKTIKDAVVVTLDPPAQADFEFVQGQYLTFRREFNGTEVRRSYSICAAPSEGKLEVGIKRVEGGAFSTWANDVLQPGTVLDAMQPAGSFHMPIVPKAAKSYIGFAGGSGITPVLSILKTVLSQEPGSSFTLVYANRALNTIMFREEIEDLKNQYMGRFNVIHTLDTDAQDIDLFSGRLDGEKCDQLFAHWIDIASVDAAFICGPEPMMLSIADALRRHGLRDDQIKFELFASAQPGRLTRKTTQAAPSTEVQKTQVSVTMDGVTRQFEMSKETSLLQGALDNALDAPFACRAGVCSTCRCRVTEGEVEMLANHALEDHEVADGFVLSCQSYPLTDSVAFDYDGH